MRRDDQLEAEDVAVRVQLTARIGEGRQPRDADRDVGQAVAPRAAHRIRDDHPDVDAVCLIQTFYALAIRVAERRGINVDRPRHLQKVTRTR